MAEFHTSRSFKLKGVGLFDQIVGGLMTGQFKIPNVTALDYQPQAESDSITGTELDNEGVSLDTVNDGDDLLVNIGFNRYNAPTLALSSMGSHSEITAGSANVTDEKIMFLNGVGETRRMNISSVAIRGIDLTVDDSTGFSAGEILTNNATGAEIGVIHSVPDGLSVIAFLTGSLPAASDVVTDDGGSTTATVSSVAEANNTVATLTTDFTVTAVNGRINVVSGGSMDIPNLKTAKVNYAYTKLGGSQIQVGTNTVIKGPFVYKATNLVDSKLAWLYIPQLNLTPSGANVLRGDDRSASTLQGVAEKLDSESAAIYYEVAA